MKEDPIVAEVRKVRDQHAAKFHYDLEAIVRDLQEQERASGRAFVRHAPRLCEAVESSTATSGDKREAQ